MTIIAAFLSILIAGFGGGFYTSNRISAAKIQRMELSIQTGNALASAMLKAKSAEVATATEAAIQSNHDLDASHVSTINALNAQHDAFAAVRLYDPGRRPSCPSAMPASASAGISASRTDPSELSAELAAFLKQEGARADKAATLYADCRRFALINNCGISVLQQ